jgi:replication factor A1
MIKFTCYTKIAPATNPPSTFPKYIYRLTPFDQIDSFVNDSKDFLDVLGVIIDVSETRNVQFRVQAEPTVARDIVIKDLGDLDIKIALWGQRVLEFCIENIYDREKSNPVVVLFVGCLARSFQGTYLSGGAACTWYFNLDIKRHKSIIQVCSLKKFSFSFQQLTISN